MILLSFFLAFFESYKLYSVNCQEKCYWKGKKRKNLSV